MVLSAGPAIFMSAKVHPSFSHTTPYTHALSLLSLSLSLSLSLFLSLSPFSPPSLPLSSLRLLSPPPSPFPSPAYYLYIIGYICIRMYVPGTSPIQTTIGVNHQRELSTAKHRGATYRCPPWLTDDNVIQGRQRMIQLPISHRGAVSRYVQQTNVQHVVCTYIHAYNTRCACASPLLCSPNSLHAPPDECIVGRGVCAR
ncbi:hypothetical protein GGS23DRAFT_228054 [Durotheca rogersii]|uniref:uncharacterized protein n=1 Tax=Durotheca rogersii TaxID=419775 RepID=UPI00221EF4DF|nr:uncharacterized protein GGS23DRAFT_228054 [Durotheca rogersii]KAI5860541.1 hypothetical protein GGS23DRAFT_228054 [Durotheca rogersii]